MTAMALAKFLWRLVTSVAIALLLATMICYLNGVPQVILPTAGVLFVLVFLIPE